jgi:hypothetical protein
LFCESKQIDALKKTRTHQKDAAINKKPGDLLTDFEATCRESRVMKKGVSVLAGDYL